MAAENSDRCIFCEIREGRASAYRIHEDDLSFAILDINPLASGHCLVLSRRHVRWWHDLTQAETDSLFGLARLVAQKISKAFHPDFVCMYARGRRVPHTHIFLVPSSGGDLLDRHFSALERAQESSSDLSSLKEQPALEDAALRLRTA
jgi:histidine triad (HIT) family protein